MTFAERFEELQRSYHEDRLEAEKRLGRELPSHELILVRGGRTGKKVHKAHPGSSTTNCGTWLRYNVSYFKVDPKQVGKHSKYILCEKCFGDTWREE